MIFFKTDAIVIISIFASACSQAEKNASCHKSIENFFLKNTSALAMDKQTVYGRFFAQKAKESCTVFPCQI